MSRSFSINRLSRLSLKVFVQVGLQIMLFPDPPDGGFTKPLSRCHRAGAPVRRIRRFAMQRCFYDGSNLWAQEFSESVRAFRRFGGEDGSGGYSLPNPESCVSLLLQCLSGTKRESSMSTPFTPPTLALSPKHGKGVGGEGRNS